MTKPLHRTPVHHELLSKVRAGLVEFRPESGLYGRFAHWGGAVFTDPQELVALYELRDAGLIRVADRAVAVTFPGELALAEWSVVLR